MYRQPEQWRKVQLSCATQDFTWGRSAGRYVDLYRLLTGSV
jgi:glycogen synthase